MSLYSKVKGPFYDSWESASEEQRQETIRARLKMILDIAQNKTQWYSNDLYQDVLSTVNVNDRNPLAKVPYLTSSKMRTALPPMSRDLISKPGTDYTVFQSGGTTGVPKTTLFSYEEMEHINELNARGFYAVGLTDQDKVANLWAVGALYMTFIHMNRMLMEYGCMNFPFTNYAEKDFLVNIVKTFKVNAFTGMSSAILTTIRQLHDEGVDIEIDKIYYGGEHFYETDKEEVRKKFGTKTILAPGYGTVDSWYIGYQCEHSDTGVFHAHDDQLYVEILDPETLEPKAPGEVGMLYVTPFFRQLTPIVRYQVGDLAYWTNESCSCGRTTPTFKLLGRGDDVLRVGYDSFDYNFIQDFFLTIDGLSGTVQLVKTRTEGKDLLTINVETEEDLSADFLNSVVDQLISRRPTLKRAYETGDIHRPIINAVAIGSLERNSRTGKLSRVKDLSVKA